MGFRVRWQGSAHEGSPLNAFDIVRGLPAPLLVEVRDEEGQPTSGTLVQIGDCSQETDEHVVMCFVAMSSTTDASLVKG